MVIQTYKIAILGAGNGGQTFAADLKQKGHQVRLWNRSKNTIDAIKKNKGIRLSGALNAFTIPDLMSTNIKEIISGADIILVVVPANAHNNIAKLISGIVSSNQLIVLNPGRTAGSLNFCNTLKKNNCLELPTIVETQSLYYTSRQTQPGNIDVLSVKKENSIATMPSWESKNTLSYLKNIYSNPIIKDSTLKIGFENIGAILHPTPVLLNVGWIESREIFFPHYYCGISKSIAEFLEKIDLERLTIASEYGYEIKSVREWHGSVYGVIKKDLFETLQANQAYASIDAPYSLNHRYLYEDIPTGLLPIYELGRCIKVHIPKFESIIKFAKAFLEKKYFYEERTLKTLNLEGANIEEIKEIFQGYNHYKK